MNFITIIFIAFSLSFDSFAASVGSGLSLCQKHITIKQSFRIAFSLAFFQASFTLFGWLLGIEFRDLIIHADHWIAFFLLSILGVRMIQEGRVPIAKRKIKNPTHWKVLIPVSIATSIDAFAIGIGFSFFRDDIVIPVLLIGFVTFIVSLTGIYMGRKLGKKLAGIAETFGGIILIFIGVKILIEHLFFGV